MPGISNSPSRFFRNMLDAGSVIADYVWGSGRNLLKWGSGLNKTKWGGN